MLTTNFYLKITISTYNSKYGYDVLFSEQTENHHIPKKKIKKMAKNKIYLIFIRKILKLNKRLLKCLL